MIHYALTCDKYHDFEGWFANSSAYDDQAGRGLVSCPHCGSIKISKAPMAPGIARSEKSGNGSRELVQALRTDEARKIHREEAEPRGIYGKATAEETESLSEEGVEFHPLPVLPEDHN